MIRRARPLAAALTAAALIGVASAPWALGAPTPTPPPTPSVTAGPAAANPALINPGADTALHIVKYSGAPVGGTADGRQQTVTGRDPLAGVTFQISRVCASGSQMPVDLTTSAGWEAAATYQGDLDSARSNRCDGGPAQVATTGSDGTITFSGLPVGLYYVEETDAPDGYTRAVPFVITLPMTNPAALNSWMYEVYAYPKNTQDTITKTVADAHTQTTDSATGGGVNRSIVYTIRSSITDGLTADQMGRYEIRDTLDPRLSYESATVAIDPDGDPDTDNNAVLESGDFDIATDSVAAGTALRVTLTAGRTKLVAADAADADATVVTTITTTLGASAAEGLTTGVIPNTASFIPNSGWATQNPDSDGISSGPVQSRYGNVRILKHAAGNAEQGLAGARFAVYADGDNNGICTNADIVDDNLLVQSTEVSGEGVLLITGLQTSDYYNGTEQTEQTDLIYYCLVETRAPDGYNLLAAPIRFTIESGDDTTAEVAETNLTVPNQPSSRLPATGAGGVAVFLLGGALLVAAGVALQRRRERDRAASAATGPDSPSRPDSDSRDVRE